jgi:pilus assembly protein CpaD
MPTLTSVQADQLESTSMRQRHLLNTHMQKHVRFASVLALLMAAPLAGCGVPDRLATGSTIPDDYRARHPIALSEQQFVLDIFPAGGALDKAGRDRIRTFVATYVRDGQGPVVIQLPSGVRVQYDSHRVVDQIRRELAANGARGYVNVGTYPAANPLVASPIRLSYVGLKAAVATRCGEWPRDLASGSSVEGWENKPYWNFGCATQSMLANQVANPRDLVNPQGETPGDSAMRTRAITKVRTGDDPSTKWTVKNSSIGTVGAD